VGAFHGGVSEPLNYMLAGYRCKVAPNYDWRRGSPKARVARLLALGDLM
jgi:hypothetical protein